jgi:hypothetical protein
MTTIFIATNTKTTTITKKRFECLVIVVSFRLRQGHGETSPKLEERRRVVAIVKRR